MTFIDNEGQIYITEIKLDLFKHVVDKVLPKVLP